MDSTPGGQHASTSEIERLLQEQLAAIRALQHHRRPVWRAIGWIFAVAAAAVIGNFVVPGAHQAFTTAACYGKFTFSNRHANPRSSAWNPYGVTLVRRLSSTSALIQPQPRLADTDEWFGAVMPFTRFCDYRVSFSAELRGPLNPQAVKEVGYGYGIGVRGTAINGVPNATTVQYDPPFNGLRLVPVPDGVNQPGINSQPFANVRANVSHHWTLTVIGSTAYVSLDGRGYQTLSLTHGNDILVRVWNAGVIITGMKISGIEPSPQY